MIASLSVLPHTSHSRVRSPSSVHVAGVVSAHSPQVCASSHIAYSVMSALTVSVWRFHILSPPASKAKPINRAHCLAGGATSPMTCPFPTVISAILLPPCVSKLTVKSESSPLQATRILPANTKQHINAINKNRLFFITFNLPHKVLFVALNKILLRNITLCYNYI